MTRPRPGVEGVQVAAVLRRMREQAGLTREDAAAVLSCTALKIGDLETGRSAPREAELGLLVDRYDVADEERAELVEFARYHRRRRRKRTSEVLAPVSQRRHADLESQAESVRYWFGHLVPGMLQSEGYACAILGWGGVFPENELRAALERRLERAVPLTRTDRPPLEFWCILRDAALKPGIGGPEVLREQIRHLLAWNHAGRNVVVQVLPAGSGAHHFLGMTVSLVQFPPAAGGTILSDVVRSAALLDREPDVIEDSRAFDLLRAQALSLDDSNVAMEAGVSDLGE